LSLVVCFDLIRSHDADGADKGIIPLTTSELFRRVESRTATDSNLSYTVEVSYIEIYNEK
jgi:kinesin family protein 1